MSVYCIIYANLFLIQFLFTNIGLQLDGFKYSIYFKIIFSHLLTNGFVNPIPKSGPALQGDDKRVENMCGFGDGDLTNDAKDVGGELEAMEQIEGLKVNENIKNSLIFLSTLNKL